jgi:hypothetical protein
MYQRIVCPNVPTDSGVIQSHLNYLEGSQNDNPTKQREVSGCAEFAGFSDAEWSCLQ